MRTLWMKGEYVAPILNGTKTTTIRRASNRLPVVGEDCALSIGPRTPFARVRITRVQPIDVRKLDDEQRAAVHALYGDNASLVEITFANVRQVRQRK